MVAVAVVVATPWSTAARCDQISRFCVLITKGLTKNKLGRGLRLHFRFAFPPHFHPLFCFADQLAWRRRAVERDDCNTCVRLRRLGQTRAAAPEGGHPQQRLRQATALASPSTPQTSLAGIHLLGRCWGEELPAGDPPPWAPASRRLCCSRLYVGACRDAAGSMSSACW